MKSKIVITALGQDCPGIVAGVTKVLYETGCNLEDSSMTILEREFAMILIASLPENLTLEVLDQRFNSVRESLHLSVFLRKLTSEESQKKKEAVCPQMISVYGVDQPGIVYQVAELLSKKKVNITDVNTRRVVESKSSLYMMMLEVEPPSGIDLSSLQRDLEDLGRKLSVTITMHPIETSTL